MLSAQILLVAALSTLCVAQFNGLEGIADMVKNIQSSGGTIPLKDSELACSTCKETGYALYASVREADSSGETVEVGHRKEGAKNARKSLKYARSEAHLTDLVASLCSSHYLLSHNYSAIGYHTASGQWHFIVNHEGLDNATKQQYDKMLTGQHIPARVTKCCTGFMEEHEEVIGDLLRQKDSNGNFLPLPASATDFARELCFERTAQCKRVDEPKSKAPKAKAASTSESKSEL